jgi:hypothetical protein
MFFELRIAFISLVSRLQRIDITTQTLDRATVTGKGRSAAAVLIIGNCGDWQSTTVVINKQFIPALSFPSTIM